MGCKYFWSPIFEMFATSTFINLRDCVTFLFLSLSRFAYFCWWSCPTVRWKHMRKFSLIVVLNLFWGGKGWFLISIRISCSPIWVLASPRHLGLMCWLILRAIRPLLFFKEGSLVSALARKRPRLTLKGMDSRMVCRWLVIVMGGVK